MKSRALYKHIGLSALTFAVAVACSSAPVIEEKEEILVEATGISQEAENAIARARAARYRVNGNGCEWDDTGSMIDEAQAQGEAGENAAAIALAQEAESIAVAALAECDKEPVLVAPEPALPVSYTVNDGDSLWGIASMEDIYSDPYQWPLIYRANSDQINDADLIYPGQVFDISRDASSVQVEEAISHAKNRGSWSIGVVEDSDKAYLGQ